jgi:hypothetical protein
LTAWSASGIFGNASSSWFSARDAIRDLELGLEIPLLGAHYATKARIFWIMILNPENTGCKNVAR